MNTRILIIFAILLIFAGQASAFSSVVINSVDVIPGQPLNTDLITFSISGWAGNKPSWVDHELFSQTGASLHLDLYVAMGTLTADSTWTYSKDIQPLPIGTYGLEVRAFDNYYDTLEDTYNVGFTVVPEPASAAMLALGAIFLASRRKRREFENYGVASVGKPVMRTALVEKKRFVKH
jgi:hypothetical protein